jgi:hypothetical protein
MRYAGLWVAFWMVICVGCGTDTQYSLCFLNRSETADSIDFMVTTPDSLIHVIVGKHEKDECQQSLYQFPSEWRSFTFFATPLNDLPPDMDQIEKRTIEVDPKENEQVFILIEYGPQPGVSGGDMLAFSITKEFIPVPPPTAY